jgi:hypothetical protein
MSQVNAFPTATNSASTITAQNPLRIRPSPALVKIHTCLLYE